MAEILLLDGQHTAIVDDIDADRVRRIRWGYHQSRTGLARAVGTVPTRYVDGKRYLSYRFNPRRGHQIDMGRFVLFGNHWMRKLIIHHKDGNALDNRRCNLQVATIRTHGSLHAILNRKIREAKEEILQKYMRRYVPKSPI